MQAGKGGGRGGVCVSVCVCVCVRVCVCWGGGRLITLHKLIPSLPPQTSDKDLSGTKPLQSLSVSVSLCLCLSVGLSLSLPPPSLSCITFRSLIHACYMYINNACNLISTHQ